MWLLALAAATAVDIAPNGSVTVAVYPSVRPGEAALSDLATYLGRMTAAKVVISQQAQQSPGQARVVIAPLAEHLRLVPEALRRKLAKPSPQACAVVESGGRIWLLGASPMGAQWAIYAFLRQLGCRWYLPGKLGESIPRLPSTRISVKPYAHDPPLLYRNMWLAYSRPAWQRREYADFARRNFQGGPLVNMGHNLYRIVPPSKFGKTHPEYFPLIGGKRRVPSPGSAAGWQPCLSNPDVVRLAVEAAKQFFRRNPTAWSFSLSPNDGYGWCMCEACRAMDPPQYRDTPQRGKGRRMLLFANAVARQLRREFPNKYVVFYAYAGSVEPPDDVRAEPGVAVALAHYGWCACYLHPIEDKRCPSNARFRELMAGWRRVAPVLFAREYFTGLRMPPVVITAVATGYNLLDDIPYYARNGFVGISAESTAFFGASIVNFYLASHMMWDPSADRRALLEDFYSGCFGPAARPMRQYFESIVQRCRQRAHSRQPILDDQFLAALRQLLDRAAQAAAGRQPYAARVQLVRDCFDYMVAVRKAGSGSQADLTRLEEMVARLQAAKSWAIDYSVHRARVARVAPRPPKPPFKSIEVVARAAGPVPEAAASSRWRLRGTYYVAATRPADATIAIRCHRLGSYMDRASYAVYDAGGRKLAEGTILPNGSVQVKLPGGAQELFVVAVNSAANSFSVAARCQLALIGPSLHFLGPTGRLYFMPRPDAREVSVTATSDAPNETVKIELYRPDGTLAASAETVRTGAATVRASIRPQDRGKPWSIRLAPASRGVCEDSTVLLGPEVYPCLSPAPEQLLVVTTK